MTSRNSMFAALIATFASASGCSAIAAAEEIVITQAKALAGNITPGDAPGYPITLSRTGSYRLGGNLIPGDGKDGIEITGNLVTLDMSGFALHGNAKARHGIAGHGYGVRIQNGSIVKFKENGVEGQGHWWTVENMLVTGNSSKGIYLGGNNSRVLHSTVAYNYGDGIACGVSCLLEGNIISRNGAYGVSAKNGSAVGNVIMSNVREGLVAISWLNYGDNTIEDNNNGQQQTNGTFAPLFPNACGATLCP